MRMRGRGKKGLGNNYTLARAMNKKSWNVKKVLESLVRAAILTCARKYVVLTTPACVSIFMIVLRNPLTTAT